VAPYAEVIASGSLAFFVGWVGAYASYKAHLIV